MINSGKTMERAVYEAQERKKKTVQTPLGMEYLTTSQQYCPNSVMHLSSVLGTSHCLVTH